MGSCDRSFVEDETRLAGHDGRGWCWSAVARMPSAILRESVVASVASPTMTTTQM